MGGNSHNEEDRVGGLGPDGSVDGILDLSGEHVLVEVILHRHIFFLSSPPPASSSSPATPALDPRAGEG